MTIPSKDGQGAPGNQPIDDSGVVIHHAPRTQSEPKAPQFSLDFLNAQPEEDEDLPDGGADDQVDDVEDQNDLQDDTDDATPAPVTAEQLQALLASQGQSQAQVAAALQALLSQQAAPKPKAQAEDDPPKVYVTPESIPQAMLALLHSEDLAERTRGLAAYGNALVTAVLRQVQADVNETYQPQFQTMMQSYYDQQRQALEWKQEFSGAYPELVATDQGRLVAQVAIQQTAQKLLSEGVAQDQISWNHPKFKSTFNAVLKSVGYVPKGSTPKTPAQPAARRAAVGRTGGARPNAPSGGGTTQVDQMAAVLGTLHGGRR